LCRRALGVAWQHGAQCSRFDGCPGESRPWHASWRLLCLSRGVFGGGRAGILAWLSSVRRFEGPTDVGSGAAQRSAWRRPVSSGPHGVGDDPAVPGMVAQRRGWPHKAGGDGGDVLHHRRVTALSWAGTGLVALRLSRVSPPPFVGCGVGKVREWATLCHGVAPAIPHSTDTTPGMAAQRRIGRTAPGFDSQAVSGGVGAVRIHF
jgi:hypothetical protein